MTTIVILGSLAPLALGGCATRGQLRNALAE
jgi:hypothetical protein